MAEKEKGLPRGSPKKKRPGIETITWTSASIIIVAIIALLFVSANERQQFVTLLIILITAGIIPYIIAMRKKDQ